MGQPTRAYTPHRPSWQRFNEFAAPLASSSGAGSAASASASGQHHPYARQYSHVYSARLAALRGRCVANARASLEKDGVDMEEGVSVNVAERIIEVKEGVRNILVGTIVKEMDPKRRPKVEQSSAADAQSFLFPPNEGGKEKQQKYQESLRSHLFDSEKGDVLHLEDESGRVELAPEEVSNAGMEVDGSSSSTKQSHALDPNEVVTGVVVAVVGEVCAMKGIMRVHSIHFAGPPPSSESASSEVQLRGSSLDDEANSDDDNEPVLLLVSGLGCGSDSPTDDERCASLALRREMLLEYLTDPANPTAGGASVCRVIVAGGGVSAPTPPKEEFHSKENVSNNGSKSSYTSIAKSNNSKRTSSSTAAVAHVSSSLRELDLYIAELLGSGVPVDYVPGWHDPTNANWPQRPMHSCLLPTSCVYVDLFGRGTNPYEVVLGGDDDGDESGGVMVLGSDGLNVADLRRYLVKSMPKERGGGEDEEDGIQVGAASCMDALNRTLKYGHIAPTGPDSLPTFPSSESDPFVLECRPSVYFAGNCDDFDTRLVDADGDEISEDSNNATEDRQKDVTRLVCIPSFAITGEVVLVKLRSLECQVVSFNDASL
mmetsp:Transcript_7536/g.14314  ORF Transcript_7536/g.14314 Transcript_7536/m.14314 type:complete len:599 (-) Transcript_7536:152-1948(-)